ncbi:MAG: sulfatase-like hydrolase/transferase [Planctomycetota bacterium]|nr:sulfatase-like hydrolase/transferase [Planctomycetota bacterium]
MPTPQRNNVIVFFTDQQRWDMAGVHGNPLDLMPNFDRAAQEGTHLYNCFTPQPVCGPARSCIQTGQFATQTGCWRNGIPLKEDAVTMAKCFRKGGYTTGYIGKWHLAKEVAVPEPARGGYEYWLGSNVLEATSDAYRTRLYDNENKPVDLPGFRVDALTDAAIRYVDANKSKPFMLFISYIEPHFQNSRDDYPAPTGYEERYQGRWTPPDLLTLGGSTHRHWGGYCGMVKRLDEAYGRLLDALKSLKLRETTNVLFTSDHACHFKTRNSEYKRSCHDGSLRVPTALTGPSFEGGGRVKQMTSLVDVAPTLLDSAGLPVPSSMTGRSILPLLNRTAHDWPEEAFAQISESQVARCVRTQRWKYSVNAPDRNGGSDSGSDRYVEEFLYDLLADPYELNNLVGYESHRHVADVMKQRLLKRMTAVGEKAPEIVNAPPVKSGQKTLDPGDELL